MDGCRCGTASAAARTLFRFSKVSLRRGVAFRHVVAFPSERPTRADGATEVAMAVMILINAQDFHSHAASEGPRTSSSEPPRRPAGGGCLTCMANSCTRLGKQFEVITEGNDGHASRQARPAGSVAGLRREGKAATTTTAPRRRPCGGFVSLISSGWGPVLCSGPAGGLRDSVEAVPAWPCTGPGPSTFLWACRAT